MFLLPICVTCYVDRSKKQKCMKYSRVSWLVHKGVMLLCHTGQLTGISDSPILLRVNFTYMTTPNVLINVFQVLLFVMIELHLIFSQEKLITLNKA